MKYPKYTSDLIDYNRSLIVLNVPLVFSVKVRKQDDLSNCGITDIYKNGYRGDKGVEYPIRKSDIDKVTQDIYQYKTRSSCRKEPVTFNFTLIMKWVLSY